ncbi:hypothetical protein ACFS7Z_12200 [Pontibacter toksunensis]|uniref:Outer membrane protein beta-barrel domain-containing protein n=1 Tax=Pontibacter toksunensis TaxID=1332631 RepID=A0ABW6BTL1_9BACT
MKTFLLALSACTLAAFSSYGQANPVDTAAAPTLKPQANQFATELNVNPFNGTLSLNNSINQLKFRYFAAQNLAVRLGMNGSRVSNVSENSNPYGTNSYRFKDERSSTTIGMNLGVEKHFTGTKRLSPYLGADFAIVKKSTEQEINEGQVTTTITGGWREFTPYQNGYSYTYHERGYTTYGINLVTGFDFYMAKNFFFGYEMNFGFSQKSMEELEVKQTGSSNSPSENGNIKNSSFSFGPSLMNGVRIGYVF